MSNIISFDATDPNSLMNALAEREAARYQQDYVPVENAAIASLDDTSIVSRSRDSAAQTFGQSGARFNRQLSRYGVTRSAPDKANDALRFKMGEATSTADTVNNARLTQFDRNRTVMNDMINIGRGVASDANTALSESSALQVGRENANRAAEASSKAGLISMGGKIGSAALYAMMV